VPGARLIGPIVEQQAPGLKVRIKEVAALLDCARDLGRTRARVRRRGADRADNAARMVGRRAELGRAVDRDAALEGKGCGEKGVQHA